MWAKIITIKRTKDLNYFSLCALNLFNTRVSQFELNYWNKWTFPQHSNLLRCTCRPHMSSDTSTAGLWFILHSLNRLVYSLWSLCVICVRGSGSPPQILGWAPQAVEDFYCSKPNQTCFQSRCIWEIYGGSMPGINIKTDQEGRGVCLL